jgi:uncharacterized membrane protein YphA (DoxX/SURF4 family)
MKPNRLPILLTEIIVALFVLLFLYTALSKLKDMNSFVVAMKQSRMIGPFAHLLSGLIPTVELAAAILLIIPRMRFIGLIVSTLLMIFFTGYVAYMMLYFSKLPCTCGGILESMSWRGHLYFNLLFLILGITGIKLSKKHFIAINRSSRIPV